MDVALRFVPTLDAEARIRARLRAIAALTDALGPLGERADVGDLDRMDSAVAFAAVREGVCVYAATEEDRVDAVVRTIRRFQDDAPRRALLDSAARERMKRWAAGDRS